MKFDLHLHSRASDGCHGFGEILALARKAGLNGLALTDHDWTGHLDEAAALASASGIRFIGGVEISACDPWTGRAVHVLGYHLGSACPAISALCEPVLAARHRTVLDTLDWLSSHGLRIEMHELEELTTDSLAGGKLDRSPVFYRQHVTEVLRRRGLPASAIGELEKKFRQPGGPWTGPRNYPAALDALEAIKSDGGLAVLAHPGMGRIWDLVHVLAAEGLDGIELDHPAHRHDDRQQVRELCERYRLFSTGGSDFHGEYTLPDAMDSPVDSGESEGNGAFPGAGLCPAPSLVYFGHHRARELRFAELMVRKAADWLRQERREAESGTGADAGMMLDASHKEGDHRDLVSRCDHAVDAMVREELARAWPGHLILTEEGEAPASIGPEPLWILDPVDGTTNFLRSGKEWAVSLALWENGRPCFGLVLEGQPDHLHLAVPGLGFWTEGRLVSPGRQPGSTMEWSSCADGHATGLEGRGMPGESARDIGSSPVPAGFHAGLSSPRQSDPAVLASVVLDASLNTLTDLARRGVDLDGLNRLICGHRSCGCASLALVRIASGSLDAFVSAKLRVWDWAAGVIMVQESGGAWTGLHGQVPDPRDPGKCPFLAGRTPRIVQTLGSVLDRSLVPSGSGFSA